jgi:hypothetical protein
MCLVDNVKKMVEKMAHGKGGFPRKYCKVIEEAVLGYGEE